MSYNRQQIIFDVLRRMRTIRRANCLSAQAQALLYLLLEIANEAFWPDSFKCSNGELMGQLGASEKSLIRYREELLKADVLKYHSGKSKKEACTYLINYCKFYSHSDSHSDSHSVQKSTDNNKTNTKTNTKRELRALSKIKTVSSKKPEKSEVILEFKKKGGTEEMAERFYANFESTNWKKNGSKVTNYINLVPSFIENWRKNEQRGVEKTENHDYAAIAAFRKKQEDEAWAAITSK